MIAGSPGAQLVQMGTDPIACIWQIGLQYCCQPLGVVRSMCWIAGWIVPRSPAGATYWQDTACY